MFNSRVHEDENFTVSLTTDQLDFSRMHRARKNARRILILTAVEEERVVICSLLVDSVFPGDDHARPEQDTQTAQVFIPVASIFRTGTS